MMKQKLHQKPTLASNGKKPASIKLALLFLRIYLVHYVFIQNIPIAQALEPASVSNIVKVTTNNLKSSKIHNEIPTSKKEKQHQKRLKPFFLIGGVSIFSATSYQSTKPFLKQVLKVGISNARIALAGGLAGATGTFLLYPFDTAKTLRQANPEKYSTVQMAFQELFTSKQRFKMYSGVLSATIFAIPSSALYFGGYESIKYLLTEKVQNSTTTAYKSSRNLTFKTRFLIHACAAACGNIASSIIFVPKECLKQQIQHSKTNKNLLSLVKSTYQTSGISGFYKGYRSTLLRNIPSAILRFAIYEELKRANINNLKSNDSNKRLPLVHFVHGAMAGALTSGIMTPLDVLKTRIATGTIPTGNSILLGFKYILEHDGIRNGLYAGAKTRMVWSSAFSAIGFGSFEFAKLLLGVSNNDDDESSK